MDGRAVTAVAAPGRALVVSAGVTGTVFAAFVVGGLFMVASGHDPFAAYGDKAKYGNILSEVEKKLISCKGNVKAYWSGGDAQGRRPKQQHGHSS